MIITPDAERTFVRITDDRLEGCEWLLRLPEYGHERTVLNGVRWTVEETGAHLSFEWSPPEDQAGEIGVAYRGEIRASDDSVDFAITRRNVAPSAWPEGTASLFCLMSRDARPFHDIDGVRSYAWKNGLFQSVNQLVNSRFAAHRMCSFQVGEDSTAENCGTDRLMAKISRDGQWVLAIATDIAGHLSCNQQETTSCIHSNPHWGPVQPGEEQTARGKVYLVPSPIEELLERYRSDFQS